MNSRRHPQLDAFVSLRWYDTFVSFIIRFLAKTSEILLGVGIIVSSANFLTDGKVLTNNPSFSDAWAWIQALAIDSSLGISLHATLMCVKQRDWIKCLLYSLLTLLLAVVAGAITNVDIFSHAMQFSMSQAMAQLGLDVKVLSTLRSIAVVGFLLMSRVKDISFKDFTPQDNEMSQPEHPSSAGSVLPVVPTAPVVPVAHMLTVDDLALLVQTMTRLNQTTVREEPNGAHLTPNAEPASSAASGNLPGHASALAPKLSPAHQVASTPTHPDTISHAAVLSTAPTASETAAVPASEVGINRSDTMPAPAPEPLQRLSPEREAQLLQAYQELQAEGSRISGRTLAERVHMARALCTRWLQQQKQKGVEQGPPSETKENEQEPASSRQE